MSRILHAVTFAEQAHRGQVRKYTNEPYIVHPLEVASILASVLCDDDVVIAGLLHDTVEDCGVELEHIEKAFGSLVSKYVSDVTDVSRPQDGNRDERKALDRAHIAVGLKGSKSIKLADLISNTRSITQHDRKFAKVYMEEKRLLLPVLVGGNKQLHRMASILVEDWELQKQ